MIDRAGTMRSLSLTQAASCENAITPKHRCTCRCGGQHHGSARVQGEGRVPYEALPETDPHHLPPKKKTLRELQREHQARLFQQAEDASVETAPEVARRYGGSEL